MNKPTQADIERLQAERDAALAEETQAREAMNHCLGNRGYFGLPSNDEERAIYAPYVAAWKAAHAKASAAVTRHDEVLHRFYGEEIWTDDRLYAAPELAEMLNLSEDRVRRLAVRLGVGRKHGRDWLFSAADVAVLRARNTQRGRPFGYSPTGNR